MTADRAIVAMLQRPSTAQTQLCTTSRDPTETRGVELRVQKAFSADSVTQSGCVFAPLNDERNWDSTLIGNPVVSCYVGDNEQRWVMYYTGGSETEKTDLPPNLPLSGFTGERLQRRFARQAIGFRSGDVARWAALDPAQNRTRPHRYRGYPLSLTECTHWELLWVVDNIVLRQNDDMWWAFDTDTTAVSDVQIMFSPNVNSEDGVYWMFYSGTGQEKRPTDTPDDPQLPLMRPGLAMSQDGYHWARIEGPHYSGALFEVGDEGAWDSMFVGRPQVMNCGNEDLRMYYHSFDATDQKFKIGLAVSKNGLSWQKQGPMFSGSNKYSFDAGGAAAQCVAYDVDHEQFVIFYEAVDADGSTSIGLAVSKDGLQDWEVYEEPVVVRGPIGSWDSYDVGTPWAVSMDRGKWRIYYSGTRQRARGSPLSRGEAPDRSFVAWEGIGVCLSDAEGPRFYGVSTRYRRSRLE